MVEKSTLGYLKAPGLKSNVLKKLRGILSSNNGQRCSYNFLQEKKNKIFKTKVGLSLMGSK